MGTTVIFIGLSFWSARKDLSKGNYPGVVLFLLVSVISFGVVTYAELLR